MARGRKGQPAEVKQAKGNPGNRPVGHASTDELPASEGGAPDELEGEARQVWADMAPRLSAVKLLRVTDRSSFARYCHALVEYWKVTTQLDDEGYTYEAPKVGGGTMRRINPLFSVQERLHRRLLDLEDRFGLTPRARQEILHRMATRAPSQAELPGTGAEDAPRPSGPVGFLSRGAETRH